MREEVRYRDAMQLVETPLFIYLSALLVCLRLIENYGRRAEGVERGRKEKGEKGGKVVERDLEEGNLIVDKLYCIYHLYFEDAKKREREIDR